MYRGLPRILCLGTTSQLPVDFRCLIVAIELHVQWTNSPLKGGYCHPRSVLKNNQLQPDNSQELNLLGLMEARGGVEPP